MKKQSFSKSKKSHFSKGVNPCKKKCQFILYLDLVKIRLKIMLKQFAEEKETFLGYKKQNFQKSKNSHFSILLVRKMPIFSSFVLGQNKTRNNT